ncbi:hypothetical protein FOL47_002807, partial [Perkinsus chesapeaki]
RPARYIQQPAAKPKAKPSVRSRPKGKAKAKPKPKPKGRSTKAMPREVDIYGLKRSRPVSIDEDPVIDDPIEDNFSDDLSYHRNDLDRILNPECSLGDLFGGKFTHDDPPHASGQSNLKKNDMNKESVDKR